MKSNSFSKNIKLEIINNNFTDDEKRIIILSFINSNVKFLKNNVLLLRTKFLEGRSFFISCLKIFYNSKKIKDYIKNDFLYIEISDQNFIDYYLEQKKELKLYSINEYKSYIIGSFLSKGWLNDVYSKNYYFELRVKDINESLKISEILTSLGIKTSILEKNSWYYIYAKKSTIVSDFLKVLNATNSLLIFEDERIVRDLTSTLKKSDSIEEYNNNKLLLNSKKEIEAINLILSKKIILSDNLNNIINLRLRYPNISLNDLTFLYNQNYKSNFSKSTINNWLKKIIEISKNVSNK